MNAEEKFNEIVELFKKSFFQSLDEEERRKLQKILEDESLARVHEKMRRGILIDNGIANQSRFSFQKAFHEFENRTKRQKNRIMFKRLGGIAAILILGITISLFYILPDRSKNSIIYAREQQVIEPGSNKAQLVLEDGNVILLPDDSLQLKEKGGVNILYKNGGLSYSPAGSNQDKLTINELCVPSGGECYLVFEDSTKIWVNSETKIKYPTRFSDHEREIYLEGEAYLEVRPSKKPFIVHTSLGKIKVLGTSFGIKAYAKESMMATLVSGKIVYQGSDTIPLTPNEQVVVCPDGKAQKKKVDVTEYTSWRSGLYVFNNRPLEMIMKDFERWYDVTVIFREASLRHLLFSGDIDRYDTINTFLELLESTEEIRYSIKDKKIELFR